MNLNFNDPFEKQNLFKNRMIEDYKAGVIPNSLAFDSYFRWKMGKLSCVSITKGMAYNMIDVAHNMLEGYYCKYPDACKNMETFISEDPWQEYKGYGDDKYIVSYLEGIEGELTNIINLLS